MGKRRLIGLVLLFAALVSGCTVPPDGLVGVGRALDGTLWVYVRTCHHRMDGATLYWPSDPNGKNSNNEVFADWTIAKQTDPLRASWPLLGPGLNGTSTGTPLDEVPTRPKNMAIYAGTDDNSFSASGPWRFTAATLGKLKPGQVLVPNDDANEKAPPNKTISLAAFDAINCSLFDDG